ncbi:hypothetical protein CRUP_019239 [Coryphaenoides rupestris]|nr:hypothetical protein CRUP_019239 [Coryphaenoides rupestris]
MGPARGAHGDADADADADTDDWSSLTRRCLVSRLAGNATTSTSCCPCLETTPLKGRVPVNGQRFGDQFVLGSSVAFHCVMMESDSCLDPGIPVNGRRRGNSFAIGSLVSFTCDLGYTLSEQEPIVCEKRHQWSHALPSCDDLRGERNPDRRRVPDRPDAALSPTS